MLVPFVIDLNCLEPDPKWSQPTERACYNSLLDVWQKSGLLAYDGAEVKSSNLFQAIKEKLPPKYRLRYQAALNEYPLLSIPDWDGHVAASKLPIISTVADVVLINDKFAQSEFSFDDDCDEALQQINNKEVSVCRLQSAAYSKLFKDAIHTASKIIAPGLSNKELWNQRFRPLAMATINPVKKINIVDRYAISQLMLPKLLSSSSEVRLNANDVIEEITRFRSTDSPNHVAVDNKILYSLTSKLIKSIPKEKSGLENFLLFLDQSATGPRTVEICSSWTKELLHGDSSHMIRRLERELSSQTNPFSIKNNSNILRVVKESISKSMDDITERVREIMNNLPYRNINRVVIYMVDDSYFGKQSHDRYIRFGKYVWSIGLGLKIFEGERTSERSDAFFKTDSKDYQAVEDVLKNVMKMNSDKSMPLVERRVIEV